jgi:DNA polymerase III delta prime subunit
MLLCGTAGLGKTSIALALCEELGYTSYFINASLDNGIDILRTKIRQFASGNSLHASFKVIILDEADSLTSATQDALRGFIEEFSKNCRFIFTCNYRNKINSALHSRCSVVEFNTNKKELQGLCGQFMARALEILKHENITYEEKVVAELIMLYAPDWRRVLNEVQRFSTGGELSPSVLSALSSEGVENLIKIIKAKDFKGMRAWVGSNSDIDSAAVFRVIYDQLPKFGIDESCLPQIIVTIGEYQMKAAVVADKEINTAAFLTETMAHAKWK